MYRLFFFPFPPSSHWHLPFLSGQPHSPADTDLDVNMQQMFYSRTMCFSSSLAGEEFFSPPTSSYLQFACFGVTPNDSLVDAGGS